LSSPVVRSSVLEVPIGNNLDTEDGSYIVSCRIVIEQIRLEYSLERERMLTCDGKDLLQHVFGDTRRQVSDVQMSTFRRFSSGTQHGARERLNLVSH